MMSMVPSVMSPSEVSSVVPPSEVSSVVPSVMVVGDSSPHVAVIEPSSEPTIESVIVARIVAAVVVVHASVTHMIDSIHTPSHVL